MSSGYNIDSILPMNDFKFLVVYNYEKMKIISNVGYYQLLPKVILGKYAVGFWKVKQLKKQ